MNLKSRNISFLIENQLPNFIVEDYQLFGSFLKSYYGQQELRGGVLDIINNLTTYRNINFYDKSVFATTTLSSAISNSQTSINVLSTEGYPDQGLVKIDDEIIFYTSKTETSLDGLRRGVHGNTKLGDLYNTSNFVSTVADNHAVDSKVHNLSNLFLFSLIQGFESEYLAGIPEKYLRGEIDKRTLIKNIGSFYKAKGTKRSIQFLFNALISSGDTDVYYPKETTLKASESDWTNVYSLRVIALTGNPEDLIGQTITESGSNFASAVVDNVLKEQIVDGVQMWDVILNRGTINNIFSIANKTTLTKVISTTDTIGDTIEVDSTFDWDKEGSFYINNELIQYSSKTARKFVIKNRSLSTAHAVGGRLYSNTVIKSGSVSLIPLGVVYNLVPKTSTPYGIEGEDINVEKSGFDTVDPIIKTSGNTIRWKFPTSTDVVQSGDTRTTNANTKTIPGITEIFEDDKNYYICSSGFPVGRTVFFNQTIPPSDTPVDQPLLRTIRKSPETTTETYETSRKDVGIFIDGVLAYSHKHEDSVLTGPITSIKVDNQGTGYSRPPFVLVNNTPYLATANMSGLVVESVTIITPGNYTTTPTVDIVSGRNAELNAVVTMGEITSITITNPGEYYSAPPTIRITDRRGRGRFAQYEARVSATGQITELVKINGGSFYTSGDVLIEIIPSGSAATATASIFEWIKNRYEILGSDKDTEHGFSFLNSRGFRNYGAVAYPPSLKTSLNDTSSNHSPIIGFAYDGNPIYGPYGYTDPVDNTSAIKRIESGFRKKTSRSNGPSVVTYPLGSFIQDYYYADRLGDVDRNNGRFCVTPEYPNGVYAYFATEDVNGDPAYPYLLGDNFYSLPLSANFNEFQTHADLPEGAIRIRRPNTPDNGLVTRAKTKDISTGSVDSFSVYASSSNLSVGSTIILDDIDTNGRDARGSISQIKGKSVSAIEATNKEVDSQKVATLQITENCYIFNGDTISQPSTGVSGIAVGDVLDGKFIVLKNIVGGTFDDTGLFDSSTISLNIVLNTNATFTKGAILEYTDGNNIIASGEVIESTDKRNSVKVKVLTGAFTITADYYLRSDNLLNTIGAEILSTQSLSTGLVPFKVDTKVALVTTSTNHDLSVGNLVNIKIDPDDSITTKNYYVQLGAIQEIDVIPLSFSTRINDQGIGRFTIQNSGADYQASNTVADVALSGGSGNGATANITTNADGKVSTIVLVDKGTGYKLGDILTVPDVALSKSSSAPANSQDVQIRVEHIGFGAGENLLTVLDVSEIADNDYISIGDEILQVTDVRETTKQLVVTRGQKGTTEKDHYHNVEVSLDIPDFRFNIGSTIAITGNTTLDPVVVSYSNGRLVVEHNQNFFTTGNYDDYKIGLGSTFFDESVPKKLVKLQQVSDFIIVTKISENSSGPYQISPNLQFQDHYQYKFDLSHFTNIHSEFLLSPSKSDNIIAPELVRQGTPGTANACVYAKFGYGARLGTVNLAGTLTDRKDPLYQRYYYKSIVTTTSAGVQSIRIGPTSVIRDEDNYVEIIQDPLQGQHQIVYVTPTQFVYSMDTLPRWYGTGIMSYTTSGVNAVGEIAEVSVANLGTGYKKVPAVLGATMRVADEAHVTAQWDSVNKNIAGVTINTIGKNYSKPKVIVTDGDGAEVAFDILKTSANGIANIIVTNKGKNYTYKPTLQVIESDLRVYAKSNSIGVTKNVEIEFSGSGIWNDSSLQRKHSSSIALILDTTDEFLSGEQITQGSTTGIVTNKGWRKGSNVLKVKILTGEFVKNTAITGVSSGSIGAIDDILETEFIVDTRSYFDNLGKFGSDKGKVGVKTHRVADNNFYQDYSYVIESESGINDWRDLIKESVHPAGFKMFGELNVDLGATVRINENTKTGQRSQLNLWNENENNASVGNSTRQIVNTINLNKDINVLRGTGSVTEQAFDARGLTAKEIILEPAFDGDFDFMGLQRGTRDFVIKDKKTGQSVSPYNAMALTITLDGILQEPEVAYTVSGDTIRFAKAPLGPRSENNASIPAQKFIGRQFEYKDAAKNGQYLKKVRQIFQKEGTWIDAANQLRFNRSFIQEEAIGYAKETFPSVSWNTLETKCVRDIGLIVDAFEHDLRYGGNQKTVEAAESYYNNGSLAYINAQLTESLATYKYTMNLCVAAMRNWDISLQGCTVTPGSDIITLPSMLGICIGMNVSSGLQFDQPTTILEILSGNRVRVSRVANTSYSGQVISTAVTTTGQTNYGPTQVTNTGTLQVGVGSTVTIYNTVNNINQVTFSFSRINNGTYMDAARLIEKNRSYITEETIGWTKQTYPNLSIPDEDKCVRDTGILVDAFVYHLRYGGNFKVVDFAEFYFKKSQLAYISSEKAESIAAYKYATDLMALAMRQNLPTGQHTIFVPFTDTTVLPDPNGSFAAQCADVEQSLKSYIDIVEEILTKGPYIVEKTPDNNQRTGNWALSRTFSNLNILPGNYDGGPGLFAECSDVQSALDSLYSNIETVLNGGTATKSLPDYFDGENVEFELYYTDNTIVNTSEKENLFVVINGVFQNAKYDDTFPRVNAYNIKRMDGSDPDRIVFAEPPKWEQELNTLTVQEPLAVEKFYAHNVGRYLRLVIDENNLNGKARGPFVMKDEETKEAVVVDDDRFLLVFLDGVLQERDRAYTINESSITFAQGPRQGQSIDMLLLVGDNEDQLLDAFNVDTDSFYNEVTISITGSDQYSTFVSLINGRDNAPVYQKFNIGQPNVITKTIGEIKYWETTSTGWKFVMLTAMNPEIDLTEPLRISKGLDFSGAFDLFDLSSATTAITYNDKNDRRHLRKNTASWLYHHDKPTIQDLEPGDRIQIDGEEEYRIVKKVPNELASLAYNPNTQLSDVVGTVSVSNYNGVTSGEGLDVVANITNGVVTSLTWNQRDITKNPTASGYSIAPQLVFESVDQTGGGAKAEVICEGGDVIDVILTQGGSGYTTAPKVNVTRGYNIIKKHRQFDTKYQKTINRLAPAALATFASSAVVLDELKHEKIEQTEVLSSPYNSLREVLLTKSLHRDASAVTTTHAVTLTTQRPPQTSTVATGSVTLLNNIKQITLTQGISTSSATTVHLPTFTPPAISMGSVAAANVYNASVLDVDYTAADPNVFATTSGFPASGIIQVGLYQLEYSSKLSDRFVIDYTSSNTTQPTTGGTVTASSVIRLV